MDLHIFMVLDLHNLYLLDYVEDTFRKTVPHCVTRLWMYIYMFIHIYIQTYVFFEMIKVSLDTTYNSYDIM